MFVSRNEIIYISGYLVVFGERDWTVGDCFICNVLFVYGERGLTDLQNINS